MSSGSDQGSPRPWTDPELWRPQTVSHQRIDDRSLNLPRRHRSCQTSSSPPSRRWLSLSRGCSARWGGRSSRQLATPQSYHGALLMSVGDTFRAARLVSWQKSQMQPVFRESRVYPLIWNQMLLGKGKNGCVCVCGISLWVKLLKIQNFTQKP